MEDAYQEVPYSEPEPKKKVSGWLIALIVVAVLVVICCLCSILAFFVLVPALSTVLPATVELIIPTPPLP